MAVRLWKANLVLEDLACQKRRNLWPKWGLSWVLIDIWQLEWWIVSWIWINKSSMTWWRNWACRHFDAASWLHSLFHCRLREQSFDQKGFSSGSKTPYSPELSLCDFFFPKLKFHLIVRYFGTVDKIQKVMTDQLRALPHEEYKHC
jgi:hypothetical protein